MATEAAKGQGNTDSITSFLGEVQLYTSIIGFIIQVWLVSKIQRYLGIGFALLILPISLGLTGIVHAPQRRAAGADDRAGHRHVAALHRRQDHARDSLPAAAQRSQAAVQAVHRRHGGPVRQRPWRAAGPGADQGPDLRLQHRLRAVVAATELGEPGDDRPVDHGRPACATRVPGRLPPHARTAGRGAGGAAAQRGRPVDHRDAGRGAGASRSAARAVRDRHARVAQQAPPHLAAAAEPRGAGRPRACAADGGRRQRDAAAALDARRGAPAER